MKFYSYTNTNDNYTKALSLQNVRALSISSGTGKSAIRFSVVIQYTDGSKDDFSYLYEEEAQGLYRKILQHLEQN